MLVEKPMYVNGAQVIVLAEVLRTVRLLQMSDYRPIYSDVSYNFSYQWRKVHSWLIFE